MCKKSGVWVPLDGGRPWPRGATGGRGSQGAGSIVCPGAAYTLASFCGNITELLPLPSMYFAVCESNCNKTFTVNE